MFRSRCSFLCSARIPGKSKAFATVSPAILPQRQPPPPPAFAKPAIPYIDSQILKALSVQPQTSLLDIIGHYIDQTGNVLNVPLPYESRPSEDRRVNFEGNPSTKEVVTIAHCARDGGQHKISLSSGFAVNAPAPRQGETLIVTCAHTLEQIRASPMLMPKEFPPRDTSHHVLTGTFVCVGLGDTLKVYPATEIVSSLPRCDVILISSDLPKGALKTLPLSPYPAQAGTPIRAHFVSHQKPSEPGWSPWIGDTWARWAKGNVLGYRDFAGRETKPGTYDALSHMLFTPFPTAGSSGGPIVEESSGTVVGMTLGSRQDDRVQGVRGWGTPSESIYEFFTLPGLEGKK